MCHVRLQQLASSKLCFQTGSGATPANNGNRFAVSELLSLVLGSAGLGKEGGADRRRREKEVGLTERLVGPALQVAKKVGVEKLSQPDGVKVLLEALEKQLLPLRKQAALELCRAGMREEILSRQTGEPMSSCCLRREAWWMQLRDMDPSIQCSDAILGEQLLQHAGLGRGRCVKMT
ncbi:unnamed protein product [Cladocopium goreaui]|uniref:Transposon Ty4-J Gag-Pol polyprotein n=1 Tax=Cladocopium goreaui TaxID=2562237 RepID=A0A9P1FI93_9DINO|nr:unnamed protein product [Cladocopium goreaui]